VHLRELLARSRTLEFVTHVRQRVSMNPLAVSSLEFLEHHAETMSRMESMNT